MIHEYVRARRKENQILRMEIDAGGDIGGECMSAAQGAEPDSCSIDVVNVSCSAYVTASVS